MSNRPVNACVGCGFDPKPITEPNPGASKTERRAEALRTAVQRVPTPTSTAYAGAHALHAITENA